MGWLRNGFIAGRSNPMTSLAGLVGGSSLYAATNGFQLPQTGAEWAWFAVSLAITVLGWLAGDAKPPLFPK